MANDSSRKRPAPLRGKDPSKTGRIPQVIAKEFGSTISGAGKLLARAAYIGLVREARGARASKLHLAPDLALAFGLAPPLCGRLRRDPLPHSTTEFPATL